MLNSFLETFDYKGFVILIVSFVFADFELFCY